jgi:hypothetical protein
MLVDVLAVAFGFPVSVWCLWLARRLGPDD